MEGYGAYRIIFAIDCQETFFSSLLEPSLRRIDGGGRHWAVIASLIATCKMNDVIPQACLRDVLTKINARHPMRRFDELLRFAYLPAQAEKAVATRRH